MHYKYKTGMLAWALFRLSGIALVVYLAMHITVISSLSNPDTFNRTMKLLGIWYFRALEIGLLLVVVYHALNGIRIFVVDFWNGSLYQARLFWILMAVGAVIFLAGAYPMFSHLLYWKENPPEKHTIIDGPESATAVPPELQFEGKEAVDG